MRNPNFAVSEDGQVTDWSIDGSDPVITVGSEKGPDGNSTIAQFKSAAVGRTLSITQPLTVCPGQQYRVGASTRQAYALAKCTAEFSIGGKVVFKVTPQESWLPTSGFFTAGQGVDGASVDLKITASCAGYGGFPVADEDGWMRIEVSGVTVIQDLQMKSRKRRNGIDVGRSGLGRGQGFVAFTWESTPKL